MKYLLGIDFGGGSSKATLIDTNGETIVESVAEYPTYHPFNGACEQSPDDWINALKINISALFKKSKINNQDILCIAIDSATHTAVLCDKNYKPLRNAIHWTDTRSVSQSKELIEKSKEEIFEKTYHKPDTIWTLPQIIWVRENEPEIFDKIKYIFFEKDYIRFFLTNVFCTDNIEAQGSMLFDYNKGKWDENLCKIAGINIDFLPPIVSPEDIIGKVTKSASEFTGLLEGTPVICGTTDTCMEIFASGAVNKNDITVKLATAGRICVVTDSAFPDEHLVNYSHIRKGLWYPGTATKAAASSYRWFRDTFGEDYKTLDNLAKDIEIGADNLYFHPYLNGELTPYADPKLCGSFIGIRSTHTKAHFARAVLEGVALSLLDSKNYLDSLKIPYNSHATLIGGGAKGDVWSKIIADVLGIELVITKSSDSSLGSAMLAGIACGVFNDCVDAVEKCIKPIKTVKPNLENTKKYNEIFKKYKKIHDALAPIYNED